MAVIPVHSDRPPSVGKRSRYALKIPSIRQPQAVTAAQATTSAVPPLEISVTHTIDDRAKTYAMSETAYGLQDGGKNGLYTVIWIWLGALLSFAAVFYEDIRENGLQEFLSGNMLLAISPAFVLLVVLTVFGFAWSQTAPRRRMASYRRHMHLLGEADTRSLTIRFDGEGVTVTEPDGATQLQPWHDNVSLVENDEWICFVTQMQEMSVVIPKRSLSAEQIKAIKEWNERRYGGGAPETPTVQADLAGPEIARTEEFSPDRNDLMAVLQEAADAPVWRAKRLRSYILLTVGLGLLTPAVFLIGWIIDPDRLPFSICWPLYLNMFSTLFWKPALGGLALVLLVVLLQPRFRRWSAGYYADQMLKNRLGSGIVIIGENGLWDGGTASRLFLPWQAMRVVKFSPERIVLTIRLGATLSYPKRIFPAEALDRIENMFRDRAGKPKANV